MPATTRPVTLSTFMNVSRNIICNVFVTLASNLELEREPYQTVQLMEHGDNVYFHILFVLSGNLVFLGHSCICRGVQRHTASQIVFPWVSNLNKTVITPYMGFEVRLEWPCIVLGVNPANLGAGSSTANQES